MAPNTSMAEASQHPEGKAKKAAAIEAVESMVQYKFKDPSLLWEALQSRGSLNDIVGHPVPLDCNRRLAIVGDAVLRLLLAGAWYTKEVTGCGDFEKNHSSAIGRNSNLDKKGLELGLDRFIFGPRQAKTVADAMEAILGAVYQDDGLTAAKDVMDALDLLPAKERIEREVDVEGFAIIDDDPGKSAYRKRKQGFAIIDDDPGKSAYRKRKRARQLQQSCQKKVMSIDKDTSSLFVGEDEDDDGPSRERRVTRQMVKDKVAPPIANSPDLVFSTDTVTDLGAAKAVAVPSDQLSSAVDALRAFCASPSNDFSRESQEAILMAI